MHIHLIAASGSGMASLASLLVQLGHRVSGSDSRFDPPMGDVLKKLGIELHVGFDARHLVPPPDCIVIGNVVRRDNPEAQAALASGIEYLSLPGALHRFLLAERQVIVLAGTHGKTTTTTLVSTLLSQAGLRPGYLIGGVPRDLSSGAAVGEPGSPFVIEGDEYDSAFFEKSPKFWQYNPHAAVLTSIEHDHVDIYPTEASYEAAFAEFVARIPAEGVLVAFAGDVKVREIAARATCRVEWYAIGGDDCGGIEPMWLAEPIGALQTSADVGTSGSRASTARSVLRMATADGGQDFELFCGGTLVGRYRLSLAGRHNLRNALAALAVCSSGAGVAPAKVAGALAHVQGARRRQELLGSPGGVFIYDDFAHHPTAVEETLAAIRARHPTATLHAVYEPRSATACRRTHQERYTQAFAVANCVWLAPTARKEVADADRLDVERLANDLTERGTPARVVADYDALIDALDAALRPGDVALLMSNGSFGGVPQRLLERLATRRGRGAA